MINFSVKKSHKKADFNFPVYAVCRKSNDLYIFTSVNSATLIDSKTGKGCHVSFKRDGENLETMDNLDVLKPGDSITLHQN